MGGKGTLREMLRKRVSNERRGKGDDFRCTELLVLKEGQEEEEKSCVREPEHEIMGVKGAQVEDGR